MCDEMRRLLLNAVWSILWWQAGESLTTATTTTAHIHTTTLECITQYVTLFASGPLLCTVKKLDNCGLFLIEQKKN